MGSLHVAAHESGPAAGEFVIEQKLSLGRGVERAAVVRVKEYIPEVLYGQSHRDLEFSRRQFDGSAPVRRHARLDRIRPAIRVGQGDGAEPVGRAGSATRIECLESDRRVGPKCKAGDGTNHPRRLEPVPSVQGNYCPDIHSRLLPPLRIRTPRYRLLYAAFHANASRYFTSVRLDFSGNAYPAQDHYR